MKLIVLGFAALVAAKDYSVSIHNGLFIGHDVPSTPGVMEWLGVPYAQPPVGDLRFAAPRAYEGSGVHVASKYV
jgi:carboxylesterase type B